MILTACFSHTHAVSQGSPYCLAPGPRTSLQFLFPASQSLYPIRTPASSLPELVTSQKLYWVSLKPQGREVKSFPGTSQE